MHKKKHKRKKEGHTGPTRHKEMGSVLTGYGKDPVAHESHHEANAAHGMHDGMSPWNKAGISAFSAENAS